MKTLDEVIKALELCSTDDDPCDKCPYTEFDKNGVWACSMCGDFAEDALHYLKEHRMQLDDIVAKLKELEAEIARYQDAVKSCNEAENKYRVLKGELEGFPSNARMNIRW